MTVSATLPSPEPTPARAPALDIVIPVHNEEVALASSVDTVRAHLRTMPYDYRITIADKASTDSTSLIAHQLAHRFDDVRVVPLTQKGRGRALKQVWSHSDAEVLVYMDVDLSTDLNALLPLVAPLLSGHSDLAIGSRLARSSRTTRGPKRELISRTYNVMLRGALRARFSDAQCGFKAIRRDVAEQLLPLIQDDGWFFDTELLIVAERAGLRIHEVPVDWIDDPDSRVDIVKTVLADLRGMGRLGMALVRRKVPLSDVAEALGHTSSRRAGGLLGAQVIVFGLIGVASTLAYGLLYILMRGHVGPQAANALALVVTAVANTAANRRITFGLTGPDGAMRHQLQGLLVFAIGLAVTSGSLWTLRHAGGDHHPSVEVVVLTAANLFITLMRFVVMHTWMFPPSPPTADASA